MSRKIRVLVAKPGLDGHDRGAKVVACALRDAGMEVIYTGLHQTPEMVVQSAIEEDVDIVAMSILSGAHLPIARKLMAAMGEAEMEDKRVLIGGNIPQRDVPALIELGVVGVFPTGSRFDAIAAFIRERAGEKETASM